MENLVYISKLVMKKLKIPILILMSASTLLAQEEVTTEDPEFFAVTSPVTLDIGENEEEDELYVPKEKKRKKKVFYGLKTKKRFTKQGIGNKTTYELFYVLKDFELPETYVRDVYWLDYRRQEIRKGGKIDPKFGAILHGSYKKMRNNQVLEEGIYYMGLKHGRWMTYDKNDLLVDKAKYYKGWPRESMVSYYDRDRKNMKEIIPIEYGEKEGYYYYFHESGRKAVEGEFHWDERVGDWVEYYASGRRKKIVRYSKDPHDDEFRPYTWKEWNVKGKLIYQRR